MVDFLIVACISALVMAVLNWLLMIWAMPIAAVVGVAAISVCFAKICIGVVSRNILRQQWLRAYKNDAIREGEDSAIRREFVRRYNAKKYWFQKELNFPKQ